MSERGISPGAIDPVERILPDLEYEINPATLGLAALTAANSAQAYRYNDTLSVRGRTTEARLERDVSEHIADIRQEITQLTTKGAGLLEAYMRDAPRTLLYPKKVTQRRDRVNYDWRQWLGKRAPDDYMLAFLEWHVDDLEAQQRSPEVQEEITTQQHEYVSGVHRLVRNDTLPKNALEKIGKVPDVKVYIGDIFDTLVHDAGGYYATSYGHVVIAGAHVGGNAHETCGVTVKNIGQSLKHEFNHAVLGGFYSRWLDESVTENLALLIADSDERTGVYENERKLLRRVLTAGRRTIPAKLAYHAYTETGLDTTVRQAFDDAVTDAWRDYLPDGGESVGALAYIHKKMEQTEKYYRRLGKTSVAAGSQAASEVYTMLYFSPRSVFSKEAYVNLTRQNSSNTV